MSQTSAEAAIMESAAKKFEQVDESLQTMLSRLMNELEVLRTSWQGASGRSFEQVKIAFAENQKVLSSALRETATAIRTSGREYTARDQDSAGRVNSISTDISLPL